MTPLVISWSITEASVTWCSAFLAIHISCIFGFYFVLFFICVSNCYIGGIVVQTAWTSPIWTNYWSLEPSNQREKNKKFFMARWMCEMSILLSVLVNFIDRNQREKNKKFRSGLIPNFCWYMLLPNVGYNHVDLPLLKNIVWKWISEIIFLGQFFLLLQIIRYSFFGMKEALGFTPSWLLWLRYRQCDLCPLD